MALNLGELTLKLSANLGDFEAKLNSAQRSVAEAGTKMEKRFDGFKESVSGLLLPTSALGDKLETVTKVTDKTGKGMASMGRHMHGAQQQAEGLVGTLGDMSTQMNLMMGGAVLTAGITAPFTLFAKSALDASIGFEDAFAGVRKTVDATEAEFGQIEDRFRSMAKTTPVTANEFARIGELAGQLGVRGVDNITAFTDTIAKLGVSTNLSTDEASTSLARFANIMQMPISKADRLGATIVDLGNNLATTEQEITTFALRIAGAGKQVGLSESQVLGFGAALSSVGINAEAGGTAISRVFAKLAVVTAKGGDDLKMFAQVAGLSASDFAQAFATDAAGATITFIEGLKRIQDSGGNVFTVLEKLELEDIRVRDALLRTAGAGDVLRRSIDLASSAWESNTALNVEAAKRFDTTASRLQVMQNNFSELGRRIGDTFAPAINSAIGSVNDLLLGLQNMPPAVQKLIVVFGGLLSVAGPLMLALAGLGAASAGIKAALPVLTAMFGALTSGPGLAVVAIAGLVVGITTLIAASRKAREEEAKKEESLRKLGGQYDTLTKTMNNAARTESERNQADNDRRKVIEEIGALFPNLVKQWGDHGEAVKLDTKLLRENTAASEHNRQTKTHAAVDAAKRAVAEVEGQIAELEEKKRRALATALPFEQRVFSQGAEDLTKGFDQQIAAARRSLITARQSLAAVLKENVYNTPIPETPMGFLDATATGLAKLPGKNQVEEEEETTKKKEAYLDEFEKAFDRSQEDMKETFSRGQQDATTLFKEGQDKQVRDKKAALDQQLSDYEQTLEKQKAAFEKAQENEKTKFEADLKDQREKKKTELDKALLDFQRSQAAETEAFDRDQAKQLQIFKDGLDKKRKDRQDANDKELYDLRKSHEQQLDAIQNRYDREALIRELDLAAKVNPLKKQIESIRATEEAEEQARRYAASAERIKKAEEALAEALKKGTMKEITEARKGLADAKADQEEMRTRDARKAQIERLQDQIEAANTSAAEADKAARVAQQFELKTTREQQELDYKARQEKLAADLETYRAELDASLTKEQLRLKDLKITKQQELEDLLISERAKLDVRMRAFEDGQTQDRKNFDQQQKDDKTHKEAVFEGLKKQKQDELDVELRKFQKSLEQEETEWKRSQETRATQYKRELKDLEDSLKDKLGAQQAFLNNWNAMAAQMQALAPDTGLDALKDAQTPPIRGGGGGGGLPLLMAEGGIATRPTLGIFGEAGPEALLPLSRLGDILAPLMAPLTNRIADYLSGVNRMALGGEAQAVMAGVGSVNVYPRIFIGNREVFDIVVEANEHNRRRGRS